MLKFSENILIKSLDEDNLLAIQVKDDYDYREIIPLKNKGKISFCVKTETLIPLLAEELVDFVQSENQILAITSDGEYKLPLQKERGVFLQRPEIVLPNEEPMKTWNYDFSKKSINTSSNSNNISQASALVVIGENLIARNVTNVLEVYGEVESGLFCISPEQYAIVQKLGCSTVNFYSTGEVQIVGKEAEVRIQYTKKVPDLINLEKTLKGNETLLTVDLSNLKLKSMAKFILEEITIVFKTGEVSFISESARRSLLVPDLEVPESVLIKMLSKDLKYLGGTVSISSWKVRDSYILQTKEADKTVYIMVKPGGEIKW